MTASAGRVRWPRNGGQLRLADGRVLGYAEYGDPRGAPLVFLHGFPGSRLAAAVLDEAARARGVRVLAPERPGLGHSSPQPGRTLLDHAHDVRCLAEQLGIDRVTILGESGGGPYALACAVELADRVDRVAVVCGLGPVAGPGATAGIAMKERFAYAVAARAPLLAGRALVPIAAWARHRPRQFLHVAQWQLGSADRLALRGPIGDLVAADFAEAFRQGGRGVAQDLALLFRPWLFDLRAIRIPVVFFHGQEDRTVAVGVTHEVARHVPGAQVRIWPRHGHFSLLTGEAHAVLTELVPGSSGIAPGADWNPRPKP
jgi:pimeloyl-ACP methyl ester carboxylesterase